MQSLLIPTSLRSCITPLSTTDIHAGFADPVLCSLVPYTHPHPGLVIAIIGYKPTTFTPSQVRGIWMGTQSLQLAER